MIAVSCIHAFLVGTNLAVEDDMAKVDSWLVVRVTCYRRDTRVL